MKLGKNNIFPTTSQQIQLPSNQENTNLANFNYVQQQQQISTQIQIEPGFNLVQPSAASFQSELPPPSYDSVVHSSNKY